MTDPAATSFLFHDADPDAVREALAESQVLSLARGAPLLRRGESNRDIYILLSGKLVIHLLDDASPENCIDVTPGECIGELSVIDGKPISASVVAASDVRVLKIDREAFLNRLLVLPGVGRNLMLTLAERMRRANEKSLAVLRERLELQHLRKELQLARQLQASMLPLQRPLFPGRGDLEACGFMEPAEKVGGDLFDAFFVDGRTLFVCIGDVSGHGIVAALFMARVIALLRIFAIETTSPEKILEALNARLCSGYSTSLFVTMFCGFLEVDTGRFVYSNAGHCPPMLCGEGTASLLPIPKGVVLGIDGGQRYSAMERSLAIGETLLCYTDGVTEAEDPDCTPFELERCFEIIHRGAESPLPNLLDSLYAEVLAHCGSRLPADDCTMLAVRRTHP